MGSAERELETWATGWAVSHRWKVLAAGVAANASLAAAATGIPTTAVWMRAAYRLGNAQLGLLLGAIGFGLALSELPWGLLTDRYGDRPVLVVGLSGTASTLAVMACCMAPPGATPALVWPMAALALAGLFGGSVNSASGRAVMAWFAESERGLAMSIRQTAVPLGGALGALVLPRLAAGVGFSAVYGVLAAMCALSAVLCWRWVRQPAPAPQAHALGRRMGKSPLRDSAVWRVAAGIGILCAPQFGMLTFATVFLHDQIHLGLGTISATMATLQMGAMVMRIWSGRYTDRHGNRPAYLRGSTVVAAAAFGALALADACALPAPIQILALLFAGVSISAWQGVAYTELATLAGPDRAGTALGMANTLVYAGLFLAPLAIPHLLAASNWPVVWLATAACTLLAAPCFLRPAPGTER